jgi:TPR repeat protein
MSYSVHIKNYQRARRLATQSYDGSDWQDWQDWQAYQRELQIIMAGAVQALLSECRQGIPEIYYTIGDAYAGGYGIERDPITAEEWYLKAAEFGHSPSMVRLGFLLRKESNDEKRAEELSWYRRAAELGNPSGMTCLGFAYRDGQGVAVNEKIALEWFIRAYEAGDFYASKKIGQLLAWHTESHIEAVKWLSIAIEHNSDFYIAYYELARIHSNRLSPSYDQEKAYRCWLILAERPRGDIRIEAMFNLAHCCRNGEGTERNLDGAKHWLDLIMTSAEKKSDFRKAHKLRQKLEEDLF